MNGNYLKINNKSDIPVNTDSWELKNALASVLGTNNIEVNRNGNFNDGASFTFDFYGVKSAVPLSGESGNLVG